MVQKVMLASLGVVLVLAVVLMATTGERDQAIGLTSGPSVGSGEFVPKDIPASRAIVYDNGMNYDGLLTAQIDERPDSLVSEPADDFMFDVDQSVNDVHWIGGYWAGPPEDFDWKVSFYADFGDGSKPGALIASWVFPNALVNETEIVVGYYNYSVHLPATLNFLAGTKYWIAIQGVGNYPPQSGWAYHQDAILLHEAVIRSVYFGIPNWTNTSAVLGYPVDMCFQLTYEPEEECDWQPGDLYKHHFPQLPDEEGWAVNATFPMVLAEDFMCMDTGFIKDFHFWGAWKNGIEGLIIGFQLSIHADIPADPPSIPYSRPGNSLWEYYVEEFDYMPIDPPTMEGWYDPATGEVFLDDHNAYWQYNICLPEQFWFWQDSGTIYWVNISAIVVDPVETQWGWKSTNDHWNDDAVWAFWDEFNWIDIWEPYDPKVGIFWIGMDPSGNIIPSLTGGTGYYPPGDVNGWWFYEGLWWEFWNIWYYDHPFTYDRDKIVHIDCPILELEPGAGSWITFVINYSTDVWSLGVGDTTPPLPGMFPPELELEFIGRDTLFDGPVDQIPGGHFSADWEMTYYNPEWISIDVWGYNFFIPEGSGILLHDCIGSLDLSLVVTGDIDTSCCNSDGIRGDVDYDGGSPNVGDLSYLVSFLFDQPPGPAPPCFEEGDVNGDGAINIGDVSHLVSFLFDQPPGPAPHPCP